MTQRSVFQARILEKLGAPLMAAVSEVAARQQNAGEGAKKQEAELVAEMLGKAVQVSVGLCGSMDIKDGAGQGDSIRLALAAMAGQMIAGQYRFAGKMPGEGEIKRMVKALEAVLAFSDNFTPAAENIARLENVEPGFSLADEHQINIQYMMALVPVVNAAVAFSFGRPESRLAQEIADGLARRAVPMREKLMGGTGEREAKQAELKILHALACLYAECHREETGRLMAMDGAARAKVAEAAGGILPMDSVWQSFELRASMLETLGAALSPGKNAGAAGRAPLPPSSVSVISEAVPLPPVQAQTMPSQAASFVAPLPEPQTQAESAAAEGGAFNPMGFFKGKPKSQEDESGQGG